MRLDLGPSLAEVKAQLTFRVDAEAEVARLRYLTPGSGQALEYQATESDARAFMAAHLAGEVPSIADYPFLAAEALAIEMAKGIVPDPVAVAQDVIAQADAWIAAGSEIKALRRGAKLAIEAASSPAEARAAAQVTWPQPAA
jgi:hypothetical protein